jgi:hypothetical protein
LIAIGGVVRYFVEDPRSTLSASADHYGIGIGRVDGAPSRLRRDDIVIDRHRKADGGIYRGNRFVFGFAFVFGGVPAAGYGERGDAQEDTGVASDDSFPGPETPGGGMYADTPSFTRLR